MDSESSKQMSVSSNHSSPHVKNSYYEVVLMSVAYSTIFILALFGNIMVILSVSRRPGMQSVMHLFICNLSIADILAAIFVLPITLLQNIFDEWLFGRWTCKSASYLQGTTVCASVTTLAIIALDRYLAICYPLKRFLNRHRAKWIIAGIWIFSCTLTSPWVIYFDTALTYKNETDENITVCTELWPNEKFQKAYFIGIMVTTLYILPLCLICYFYCTIAIRVLSRFHGTSCEEKSTNSSGKFQTASSNGQGGRRGLNGHVVMRSTGGISKAKTINIVKMLATVVAVFAFSWLPFYTIATTIYLIPEDESIYRLMKPLAFSQWLGASNYCVNPWIYCFYSKKYRESFKAILLCRWRHSSRRHYRPFILESTVARTRVLKQDHCDSVATAGGPASSQSCNAAPPFSRETCL